LRLKIDIQKFISLLYYITHDQNLAAERDWCELKIVTTDWPIVGVQSFSRLWVPQCTRSRLDKSRKVKYWVGPM